MEEIEKKDEIMSKDVLHKASSKISFFRIDKEMIRFKGHFFLFYGAVGAMFPYIPLIAKDRIGLSATSLATVLAAQLFITALSKPALGYMADYFKRIKVMMSVLIIVHCLFFLSLLTIPSVKVSPLPQNLTLLNYFNDYKNDTEILIVSLNKSTTCNTAYSYRYDTSSDSFDKIEHLNEETDFFKDNSDTVCVGQLNSIEKILCFELGNNTESGTFVLGVQLKFCCSMYSTHIEQLKTQMATIEKSFFRIHSLNSSITYERFNRTTSCMATFADTSRKGEVVTDFETYQLWLYACIMILAGTCSSSVFTLSDTICCESIQKYKRDFGRQRLYSAIGWGILAPLGGILNDITNDFYSTWILMAILQALTLWNLYKMDLVIPQFSKNLAKDIGTVLRSKTFLAFNAGNFVNGIGTGVIWYYLVWFISTLGASAFLCGLIPYVQCFTGEIPFMFFSGWVIRKVGHFNLISLSLLSYAVRFLWYSYLQNPWLVLPIEITHGFTYGVFYPTIASFGKLSAQPGTEATTQSVLFATHEGLGAGLGCVLAGIGFDRFGGHWTFFYLSLFAFGSTFLNICSTLFFGKRYMDDNEVSLKSSVK